MKLDISKRFAATLATVASSRSEFASFSVSVGVDPVPERTEATRSSPRPRELRVVPDRG